MAEQQRTENAFKPVFKKFKAKSYKFTPSDMAKPSKQSILHPCSPELAAHLGINTESPILLDEYDNYPGLMVVRNLLSEEGILNLSWKALSKWVCADHKSNLDPHVPELHSNGSLWASYVHEKERQISEEPPEKQAKIIPVYHDHTGKIKNASAILEQLRWVTIGYQYDWTEKAYRKDDVVPMPEDIVSLCHYLCDLIKIDRIVPEAGIINFYHPSSTLGAHTDHSEIDKTSALFSISLGLPCILLVGGQTLDIEPTPIYLRSGDAVIMSGNSRLAYHAVPKILSCVETTSVAKATSSLMQHVTNYLCHHRINLNIRQVLPTGQSWQEVPSEFTSIS